MFLQATAYRQWMLFFMSSQSKHLTYSGVMFPHEGVGGVVMVTTHRGLVDEPRHEPMPAIFEEAGAFVRFHAKRDLLEHLGELVKIC